MGELIDLYFENVPRTHVDALFHRLVSGGSVVRATSSDSMEADQRDDVAAFLERQGGEPRVLSVLIVQVHWQGLRLRSLGVRVIQIDEAFDVDASFDEDDVEMTPVLAIPAIHQMALELRNRFGVGHVYCGLDPAQDRSTEFFVDDETGPLH